MKYSILTLCFFALLGKVHTQVSYAYSPDSSVLGILNAKSLELDSIHTQVVFDLKGRWHYKKCKKVHIAVRGSYILEASEDTLPYTILTFEMFGKSFNRHLYPNKDYIEIFVRPGRFLYKKPKIIISTQSLPPGRIIYIDVIDISANK